MPRDTQVEMPRRISKTRLCPRRSDPHVVFFSDWMIVKDMRLVEVTKEVHVDREEAEIKG